MNWRSRLFSRRVLVLAGLLVLVSAVAYWVVLPLYHRYLLTQAEKALAAYDNATAERLLDRLLRGDRNNQRAMYLYAEACRRVGQIGRARRALYRAMELGVPREQGEREAALIEATDGKFDEVGGTLLKILEANPDDTEVLEVVGKAYLEREYLAKALTMFERLVQAAPHWPEAYRLRAEALRRNQNYSRAIEDLRHFLSIYPDDFDTRFSYASCLLFNNDLEESEKELARCQQLDPRRTEVYFPQGICAFQRGEIDTAARLFNKALDANPTDLGALKYLGNVYLIKREYEPAVDVFERVLEISRQDVEGHAKLAQALKLRGRKEDAQRIRQLEEFSKKAIQEKFGGITAPGAKGKRP